MSVGTFGALADCGLLMSQEARGRGEMVFNEKSKISYKTKTESVIKFLRRPVIAHSVFGLIKIDLFLNTVRRVRNFYISLHFCRQRR